MAQPTKTIPKGELDPPRRSARHFVPRPTKPGIGRPAAGAASQAPKGSGRR